MSKKIGFVILHYMALEDTVNCVESILNNVPLSNIVIVDNASTNKSGMKLAEMYKDNQLISVLLLEENLGFAKGNNKGIEFFKTQKDIEFIVLLNNDTLILDNTFEQAILEEYKRSEFSVLGPMVIDKNNGITSNPVEYVVDSVSKANTLLFKRYIKLILNYIGLNSIINGGRKKDKRESRYDNQKRYENVKLHGCCLIISPNFIERFKKLNESTFLYFEEDILFIESQAYNGKLVYNPDIKIIHLEDSATNMITKSNRNKNIFVLKNEIKSLKILKKIIKDIKRRKNDFCYNSNVQ